MKDQNQNNKTNKGLIMLVIVLIIIILGMGGYIIYSKSIPEEDNNKTNIQTNSQTGNQNGVEEEVKTEEKVYVYSKYEKKDAKNIYDIPYIDIETDEIKKVNDEIEKYYKPIITEMDEANKINEVHPTRKINYEYYINGDILSLRIKQYSEFSGSVSSKSYNINIKTKKVLANSDLLKEINITEEDFKSKLKEAAKNKFISVNKTKKEWQEGQNQDADLDFYDEQLNQTISEDNINIDNLMFLNRNGKITVVLKIYLLAGSEFNQYDVELDI